MNEPVPVTITVEAEGGEQGLKIRLVFSDPDVQVDGERVWMVDLKPRTPMQFSTTIRFIREGYYSVHAQVYDAVGGMVVQDAEDVRITALGGTLNPPSELTPGVPEPVTTIEVTPLSSLPTPAPTSLPSLEERPTPWDRSLPRLQPDEILARCGWSTGTAPPTLWENAKVWVEIPEQAPLDTPVHVVVGLEVESEVETDQREARSQEAWLALCLDEPGAVVEGAREWPVVVQPGTWITVTATLRFTQVGEFAVRAAAYDPATGRVAEGGQRIVINQEQEIGFLPPVMRNYGRGGAMAVPGETTFTSPLATPDARPQPFESPLPMPEAEPETFRSPLPTPVGP